MPTYAVTVVGRDAPGIIATVTAPLADLGLNLEDSTMTLLRGRFAMVLIVAGPADRSAVETALGRIDGLTTTVQELAEPAQAAEIAGAGWVLSVHGGDRPGIVAGVLGEVARAGGNVTDLSTRLAGGLYVLVAEVDLPAGADADTLAQAVRSVAERLGVSATLRPAEADRL